MEVKDALHEAIRITRASERLGALVEPLKTTFSICTNVLEVAPELEPEIAEIRRRVEEVVEHVVAAGNVLSAKLELID